MTLHELSTGFPPLNRRMIRFMSEYNRFCFVDVPWKEVNNDLPNLAQAGLNLIVWTGKVFLWPIPR